MRSTYLDLRGTCTWEIAIIYGPLYLKQSVDGAIMDPLEGTSTETRTTTTSEEGAEKTAQAAALKGLLKESILEVLRENPTGLGVSVGEGHWSGSWGVLIPLCLFNPTGLGVGVGQSHCAGSRSWLIPLGWEPVVDLTGL